MISPVNRQAGKPSLQTPRLGFSDEIPAYAGCPQFCRLAGFPYLMDSFSNTSAREIKLLPILISDECVENPDHFKMKCLLPKPSSADHSQKP
jgi:hypothetical protein